MALRCSSALAVSLHCRLVWRASRVSVVPALWASAHREVAWRSTESQTLGVRSSRPDGIGGCRCCCGGVTSRPRDPSNRSAGACRDAGAVGAAVERADRLGASDVGERSALNGTGEGQEATSRRCRTCSVLGDVPIPAGVPDGDPPAQARGRACGVASPTGSSIVVCRCARESGRFHVADHGPRRGGGGATWRG